MVPPEVAALERKYDSVTVIAQWFDRSCRDEHMVWISGARDLIIVADEIREQHHDEGQS